MTETNLFVSSCSRRELARRRGPRRVATLARMGQPALLTLACLAVCAAAFIAGRGGI